MIGVREWSRRLSTVFVPILLMGGLIAILIVGRSASQRDTAELGEWTCSMHPQVRLPAPGRCPICGMTLIPVAQLASEQSRIQTQAGIETEPVKRRALSKEIRTVGKLDYDESRIAVLTARVDGRVDRVFADFTGIPVNKGDHLVEIYSPDLYSAQAELFQSLAASEKASGDRAFREANVESVRTKILLLGILPEQLAEMEKNRKERTHLTVYAPIGGIVTEKNIVEQQYVEKGDVLFRIAELDPIWLYLDIFEYDLRWIRYGQTVEAKIESYPDERFTGTIVFLDPFLSDATRTVRVRVNMPNPEGKLKPAMYASATIGVRLGPDGNPEPTGLEGKFFCRMHPDVIQDAEGRCPRCGMLLQRVPHRSPVGEQSLEHAGHPEATLGVLAVRRSAVLDTGRRHITYRKRDDGAYELVEVKIGALAEAKDNSGAVTGYYPVLSGLSEGDEVVVQGGFLLDSQRQIEGMPSLLYSEGQSAAGLHSGHGGQAAQPPAGPASEHKH